MMKKFIAPLLALLVSGCQIDPYTHAPTLTSTDWYDVGMEDAISGNDSNLLIVFYVQIMPDDFVMQLHRF